MTEVHARSSGDDLSAQPWRDVPREEARWMRPHLPALVDAMVEGVLRHVPEYARPDVRVYDPAALGNARRAFPDLRYGDSAFDVAEDADVVVLLTEWAVFREVEPEALAEVVAHRRVVDGRHALDAARWRAAGWEYRALGRN